MFEHIKMLVEFLVITVFLKYIVLRWVAEKLAKLFMHFFVRTEREAAIWLHYRNKAMHRGHQHHTPVECYEGRCRVI